MAPDPAGQYFSPYVYVGNSPLNYVDPDGEFGIIAAIIIGAAIGGTINVVQNWDNIDNFWEGAGFFGIGASTGALSPLGPGGWVAGGFISGAGNTALNGGDFGSVVSNGFVGGFSGLAGGVGGRYASKLGVTFNGFGIKSPFVKGLVAGSLGGAGSGFAGGFTGSLVTGGDFGSAFNAGLSGARSGAAIGAPVGAVSASVQAHRSGFNPLTGKQYNQSRISADEFLNVARDYLGDDFVLN